MGTVVISLDAELAWGFHDLPAIPYDQEEAIRSTWKELLELLDEFELPTTWAVVGHLLMDSCNGVHEGHPLGGEWFSRDPGGSVETDSLWYAPDLIDAIKNSEVDHDIGCHTFSHVEFGDQSTTRETAEVELNWCRQLAEEHGISMESFVYPRNIIGHRKILAKSGILSYRGGMADGLDSGSLRQKMMKLMAGAGVRIDPPIVTPYTDEYDLVNIPASLYLFGFEGVPNSILNSLIDDPICRLAKRGVDRLIENDGVLHLWFHPHNLAKSHGRKRLREIFGYIHEKRNREHIRVQTMKQVARQVIGNESGR